MWRAVGLLRAVPEGASVPRRWERDRDAFTYYHQTFGEAYPQARRDPPVRAARRLHDLERAQDAYDAQRAFDDPLVMAEHRLAARRSAGGSPNATRPGWTRPASGRSSARCCGWRPGTRCAWTPGRRCATRPGPRSRGGSWSWTTAASCWS
ncbi:hypothetical protein [Actinomadura madurae]|nr:hypothetical protein [Actinomadura madurae]MCQ0021274.1 hypothetical protein [Actinomadura madurae]